MLPHRVCARASYLSYNKGSYGQSSIGLPRTPQSHGSSTKQHEFNKRVVDISNGLLAPPNPDAPCLVTAMTHANQDARCAFVVVH